LLGFGLFLFFILIYTFVMPMVLRSKRKRNYDLEQDHDGESIANPMAKEMTKPKETRKSMSQTKPKSKPNLGENAAVELSPMPGNGLEHCHQTSVPNADTNANAVCHVASHIKRTLCVDTFYQVVGEKLLLEPPKDMAACPAIGAGFFGTVYSALLGGVPVAVKCQPVDNDPEDRTVSTNTMDTHLSKRWKAASVLSSCMENEIGIHSMLSALQRAPGCPRSFVPHLKGVWHSGTNLSFASSDIRDRVEDRRYLAPDGAAVPCTLGKVAMVMEMATCTIDSRHFPRNDTSDLLKHAVGIMDAVNFLHESGVVHGDIAPKNVLFGANGNMLICDFGISHRYGLYDHNTFRKNPLRCSALKRDLYICTRNYRPPELLALYHVEFKYDLPKIDVWAAVLTVMSLGLEFRTHAVVGASVYGPIELVHRAFGYQTASERDLLKPLSFGDHTTNTLVHRRNAISSKLIHSVKLSNPWFLDWLVACIVYEPTKRPTAAEASAMAKQFHTSHPCTLLGGAVEAPPHDGYCGFGV
jgi:serine/threonine protein kinase